MCIMRQVLKLAMTRSIMNRILYSIVDVSLVPDPVRGIQRQEDPGFVQAMLIVPTALNRV